MNPPKTIAIIGLGLMGGSLAAACRGRFPRAHIVGITRNRTALRTARRRGWIHQGFFRPEEGVSKADLAVLCTPVDTFPSLMHIIEKNSSHKILVTDVGSVKGAITEWYSKQRWKHVRYVGAHPMVGSHHRGMEAAVKTLYCGGLVFLTRPPGTLSGDYRAIAKFWRKICPRIVPISARSHDQVVSRISHLPHAIAVALMNATDSPFLGYAASGFLDTTRIAASHPSIWLPIFMANRHALTEALGHFGRHFDEVRNAIASGNAKKLLNLLRSASRRRQQI